MLQDYEEANEITQEAFLAAWKGLPALVLAIPVGTIKTHLFRARHLLKEQLLAQHIYSAESRELP